VKTFTVLLARVVVEFEKLARHAASPDT